MKLFPNNQLDRIKSEKLKAIGHFLITKGYDISYLGKAWSNPQGDWIYFNTKLDISSLRQQFDTEQELQYHENTDPKSGTESGFFDPKTEEGLMGIL